MGAQAHNTQHTICPRKEYLRVMNTLVRMLTLAGWSITWAIVTLAAASVLFFVLTFAYALAHTL